MTYVYDGVCRTYLNTIISQDLNKVVLFNKDIQFLSRYEYSARHRVSSLCSLQSDTKTSDSDSKSPNYGNTLCSCFRFSTMIMVDVSEMAHSASQSIVLLLSLASPLHHQNGYIMTRQDGTVPSMQTSQILTSPSINNFI